MRSLLRLVMAAGGWRLLNRTVNRWAERGMTKDAAGRQAGRQRRRTAGAAMRGVRVLSSILRRMR